MPAQCREPRPFRGHRFLNAAVSFASASDTREQRPGIVELAANVYGYISDFAPNAGFIVGDDHVRDRSAADAEDGACLSRRHRDGDRQAGRVHPVFQRVLPFGVSRAWDERLGNEHPRVWTADRDRELWQTLLD